MAENPFNVSPPFDVVAAHKRSLSKGDNGQIKISKRMDEPSSPPSKSPACKRRGTGPSPMNGPGANSIIRKEEKKQIREKDRDTIVAAAAPTPPTNTSPETNRARLTPRSLRKEGEAGGKTAGAEADAEAANAKKTKKGSKEAEKKVNIEIVRMNPLRAIPAVVMAHEATAPRANEGSGSPGRTRLAEPASSCSSQIAHRSGGGAAITDKDTATMGATQMQKQHANGTDATHPLNGETVITPEGAEWLKHINIGHMQNFICNFVECPDVISTHAIIRCLLLVPCHDSSVNPASTATDGPRHGLSPGEHTRTTVWGAADDGSITVWDTMV